jgi:hypothetical protein
MTIKPIEWKVLVIMSRFGHTLDDYQMCFWPPELHNLNNFFEDELLFTVLNRKSSIFMKFWCVIQVHKYLWIICSIELTKCWKKLCNEPNI